MCSYCEKTFRTREGLKDHEDIIHTKVGLKHCAACGEEFTTNRGLKSHMNLKHGVEERFQCKFCGFYFLSVEGHRAHEETAPCKAKQSPATESNNIDGTDSGDNLDLFNNLFKNELIQDHIEPSY